MNNYLILFVVVFLIAILIAIKISSESNDSSEQLVDDELINIGDLVEFQQEFDDGFYEFSLGEQAWVTEFVDCNHVVVSNKHDGYCASDGCEPFKFCTVPISILKKVIIE